MDEVLGAIGPVQLLDNIFSVPPQRSKGGLGAGGSDSGSGSVGVAGTTAASVAPVVSSSAPPLPSPPPAPTSVLPVALYLQLERAREAECRASHKLPAEVEALQIKHKLLFDIINEELLLAERRSPHVGRQLRSARGGGAPRSAALQQLETYFISTLHARLRATLSALSRNVGEAGPTEAPGAEPSSRAAALARADVRTGAAGDALEELAEEEALIANLVADDLAAELQEEALQLMPT